jgi:hypothetical protein
MGASPLGGASEGNAGTGATGERWGGRLEK